MVAIVHHLRCSEARPAWQNRLYRLVERRYLASVQGFIFNSRATQKTVEDLVGQGRPSVLAYPGADRFASPPPRQPWPPGPGNPAPCASCFWGTSSPGRACTPSSRPWPSFPGRPGSSPWWGAWK